jgi:hypothetical protein
MVAKFLAGADKEQPALFCHFDPWEKSVFQKINPPQSPLYKGGKVYASDF